MDALVDIPAADLELLKPPWGSMGRAFVLGAVSGFSKLVLGVANTLKVENHHTWLAAVYDRPKDVGLITIANHASMFDDPGILSAITPWSYFWTEPYHGGNRWTLCAKEVCFRNELLRQFFANGKTLPIVRGGGVQQPVMRLAASLVGDGGWVHVFPEGRIKYDGRLGPFKRGAGKLVCDSRLTNGGRDPLIIPFFHSGMGRILPMHSWFFRAGHTVNVSIGEPIDVSDITCDCNRPGVDQEQVWERIVLRMREALAKLEQRSPPNVDQLAGKRPAGQPEPTEPGQQQQGREPVAGLPS